MRFATQLLNVKLERKSWLAVDRGRYQHIADCVCESDRDRKAVVVKTRIEVDLCQTKNVQKNSVERAVAPDDLYQKWIGGFRSEAPSKTAFVGTYMCGEQSIVVASIPGKGDVVAATQDKTIIAECKGGIVNTRHAGQTSRLRKGLCEAVGLLMARAKGGQQVAVVPHTETTLRLARKLAPRARDAGIEISLVDELGRVTDIVPDTGPTVQTMQ
jgi:hypothetical protein